ncbi:MAG TPA: hypothetical protein VG146_13440 [Verrucomicrobiae bacterium]|nr:hypothetical protein [Verrucomicrobiae bacterium]
MNAPVNVQQRICKAVLEQFQELLRKWKEQCQGLPLPESVYVEQWDRPRYLLPAGVVIAKWTVTRQGIVELPLSSARPSHVAVGLANCYRTAWGEFAVGEDGERVTIGFKHSPWYGRGDIYRVGATESGNVRLERMKPAWSLTSSFRLILGASR